MTGMVVLIAVLIGFTTLALWLEARDCQVWSWLYGTTDPRELVERGRREWCMDLRKPGESFCADCPDHEACATGWPCELVQHVDRQVAS